MTAPQTMYFPTLEAARAHIMGLGFQRVQEIGQKTWRDHAGRRAWLQYRPFHGFYWVIQKE